MMFSTSMSLKSTFLHEWVCEHSCENVTPSLVKIADKILFPTRYWLSNKKTVFIKFQDTYYVDYQQLIQNKTSGCKRTAVNITTALLLIPSLVVGSVLKIIAIVKEKFVFSHPAFISGMQLDPSIYESALLILKINQEQAKSFDQLNIQRSLKLIEFQEVQKQIEGFGIQEKFVLSLKFLIERVQRAYLTIVKHHHPDRLKVAEAVISKLAALDSKKPKDHSHIKAEEVN